MTKKYETEFDYFGQDVNVEVEIDDSDGDVCGTAYYLLAEKPPRYVEIVSTRIYDMVNEYFEDHVLAGFMADLKKEKMLADYERRNRL